jgi:AraC family transcriptional regulator
MWDGMNAMLFRNLPGEAPDASGPVHTIAVPLQQKQLNKTERVIDGKRKHEEVAIGDVVIIPANTVSRAAWDSENEFMMFFLDPVFVRQIAHESIDPNHVEILPQFATPDPMIHQIGLMVKAELESPGVCNRLYIDSLATMLAMRLLRQYSTQPILLHQWGDALPKSKLIQAITYINDNLSEDLSLAAIASSVGMSFSYFSKLFKGSTGVTVHQYVLQRRMENAKRLLARSNLSIIEIVYQVGFRTQNHFHNLFRKYTGMTPKAYRMSFK